MQVSIDCVTSSARAGVPAAIRGPAVAAAGRSAAASTAGFIQRLVIAPCPLERVTSDKRRRAHASCGQRAPGPIRLAFAPFPLGPLRANKTVEVRDLGGMCAKLRALPLCLCTVAAGVRCMLTGVVMAHAPALPMQHPHARPRVSTFGRFWDACSRGLRLGAVAVYLLHLQLPPVCFPSARQRAPHNSAHFFFIPRSHSGNINHLKPLARVLTVTVEVLPWLMHPLSRTPHACSIRMHALELARFSQRFWDACTGPLTLSTEAVAARRWASGPEPLSTAPHALVRCVAPSGSARVGATWR